MSSWRDYAQKAESAVCAESAISADSPSTEPLRGPFGTNGTNGTASPAITMGLAALSKVPAPRVRCPQLWPRVVADAVRLAADGWAAKALSLGWSPLDLWGCSPLIGGNPDHDGLAVWLDGRRILLLDERTCMVDAGAGARAVFTRRPSTGAVLLWELRG